MATFSVWQIVIHNNKVLSLSAMQALEKSLEKFLIILLTSIIIYANIRSKLNSL